MTQFQKLSWKEPNRILEEDVPGCDHYLKAKAERDYRLKRLGFLIAGGAALVAAAIRLF